MNKVKIQSNAKVNLALDILGYEEKGPFKGYHFIQTVLCEITPKNTHNFSPDVVVMEVKKTTTTKPEISIKCSDKTIPTGPQSPLHKTAKIVLQKFEITRIKLSINIEKNIPISSGLGGGSSNIAAVIKGVNYLFGLKIKDKEMQKIAGEVSMDAPFFIKGGLALGENYGEILTQLPPVDGMAFTLFAPSGLSATKVSTHQKTKSQYSKIDLKKCGKNIQQTLDLLQAIRTNDNLGIHKTLHNDFETLLGTPLPQNHHMTGAGPARFMLA